MERSTIGAQALDKSFTSGPWVMKRAALLFSGRLRSSVPITTVSMRSDSFGRSAQNNCSWRWTQVGVRNHDRAFLLLIATITVSLFYMHRFFEKSQALRCFRSFRHHPTPGHGRFVRHRRVPRGPGEKPIWFPPHQGPNLFKPVLDCVKKQLLVVPLNIMFTIMAHYQL